jgi:hypothetical protein
MMPVVEVLTETPAPLFFWKRGKKGELFPLSLALFLFSLSCFLSQET